MKDDETIEVLLVEDDPNDVELTLRTLQKERLANRIEVARDGAEALDFLFCRGAWAGRNFTNAPKMVLLDIKLPKVDGLEVLAQIRNEPRLRRVPVIMVTSSREDPDLERAYELGANSYVVKPVDFAKFAEAIKNLGMYWLLLNEAP